MRLGPKRAIWRHSSEPIEPPAPLTNTVRPLTRAQTALSSSLTGWRPSRSSGSISRTRSMRERPSRSSSAEGTVVTGKPVAAASAQHALAVVQAGRGHGQDKVGDALQAIGLLQQRHAPPDVDAGDGAAVLLAPVVVEQADHGASRGAGCRRSATWPPRPRPAQGALAVGGRAGCGVRARLRYLNMRTAMRPIASRVKASSGCRASTARGTSTSWAMSTMTALIKPAPRQTQAGAADVVKADVAPAGAGHVQGPRQHAVDGDDARDHGPVIQGRSCNQRSTPMRNR